MAAAREGVEARACDLGGDDLAQRARHQHVVISRDNQGRRMDVSKAVAGIAAFAIGFILTVLPVGNTYRMLGLVCLLGGTIIAVLGCVGHSRIIE